MFRTCIVLAGLAACGSLRAERAVLECTADAWIAPGETVPHGREDRLELRRDGAVLLAFRSAAVEGWRISRATLLLHPSGGGAPRTVRVAPLSRPWSESRAAWLPADLPPGRTRRARPYQEGWIAIELQPQDLGAAGIALRGAEGRFSSRESAAAAPYLLVEGSR